jgi:hypothetical protein
VAVTGLPPERRSHPRQQVTIRGSNPLIVTLGVLPRAALIHDLCPDGLGLLTTFAPPIGAIVPVWAPSSPGEPSALILAVVIHVQEPTGDGLYRVGLACHDEGGRRVLRDLIRRLESDA